MKRILLYTSLIFATTLYLQAQYPDNNWVLGKSAEIVPNDSFGLVILDFRNNQLIDAFPVTSEFVFDYIYANYNGDKRACDDSYYQYFDRRAVPFPSNEQMIYDTGEDLKAKLKAIITNNKFRR